MIGRWAITDKGDARARALAEDHYTRQTPGALMFTRNGQNLVFLTPDLLAVWVTFRPTPGKAVRSDKLEAWECALFRNTGPFLSSELIIDAVLLSMAIWGPVPKDGFITFVKPDKVKSPNPGYCYKKAGWKITGQSKGKPRLTSPSYAFSPELSHWKWLDGRGGKLRKAIGDSNGTVEVSA